MERDEWTLLRLCNNPAESERIKQALDDAGIDRLAPELDRRILVPESRLSDARAVLETVTLDDVDEELESTEADGEEPEQSRDGIGFPGMTAASRSRPKGPLAALLVFAVLVVLVLKGKDSRHLVEELLGGCSPKQEKLTDDARAPRPHLHSVRSPDGRLELKLRADGGTIHYAVLLEGQEVIMPTPISIDIAEVPPLSESKLSGTKRREVNEAMEPVVPTFASRFQAHGNELVLTLSNGLGLQARAYDDMVAFRWQSHRSGEITVIGEGFGYRFAKDYEMFYPVPNGDQFLSHQENTFPRRTISETGDLKPGPVPFLVDLEGGQYLLSTDINVSGYPGLYIEGTGEPRLEARFPAYPLKLDYESKGKQTIPERASYIAATSGPRSFPWRAILITTAEGLLSSGSLYSLADESKISDTSWIEPGKVVWDWWHAWNITDVPFEPGINQETYRHYIDHASANGLRYVIMDEGWSKTIPEGLLDVVPEIDMPALASYARDKGVGLILWMTAKSLELNFDAAFHQFDEWGIRGLKVDFMLRDDQEMMDFCERIAETAAQHRLIVDFHGGSKPTGLQRTWPNVLEHESVLGLEQSKWSTKANPDYAVLLPFIRMAVGPMDYTPGAMVNRQRDTFKADNDSPMSLGTRCHQLAMYVVYLAPLQMLADSPSNYRKHPTSMEFLRQVPTTWDETRVLAAEIGETIAVARRKGETWYIGALTNWSARRLELELDFLGEGEYRMKSWEDGPGAAQDGTDNVVKETVVGHATTYAITMAPGGGFAAMIGSR